VVFVAPGNAGTELEDKLINVDIGVQDISALIDFAKRNDIDITIVGPEAPLVIGVVDAFQAQGLSVFGPTQAKVNQGTNVLNANINIYELIF
jgi:phosphoribosylamine--glycine ligase